MTDLLYWFLEIDDHLMDLAHIYGPLTYFILFMIIYSETGLVVAAFLPGDGLLFSAGVIAAAGALNIWALVPLLILAAILGNVSNYFIGRYLGKRMVAAKRWRLIKQKDLDRTHAYYEKHGGMALILGRFLPVVRTLVPFVAGLGRMDYVDFMRFNIIGALAWVTPLTFAGYIFGDLPWVQSNFGLIYLGLVVVTAIPLLWGAMNVLWRRLTRGAAVSGE